MVKRIRVQLIDIPHHSFLYFAQGTEYKEIEKEIKRKYGKAHKWASEVVEVDDRIPKLKSKIAELKLIVETEKKDVSALKKENRMLRTRARKALACKYFLEDCCGAELWKKVKLSETYFERANREIDGVPEPVILTQEEKDQRLAEWLRSLPPEHLRRKE